MQADIYPLYETVGYPSSKLQEIQKYIRRLKLSQNAQTRLNEIVADLSLYGGSSVDSSWLIPFTRNSVLLDYLPADSVIFWDEPKQLKQRVLFLYNEHAQRVENLSKVGETLPMHFNAFVEQSSVFQADFPQIALQTLPYQTDIFVPQVIYNLKTSAVPELCDERRKLGCGYKKLAAFGIRNRYFGGRRRS